MTDLFLYFLPIIIAAGIIFLIYRFRESIRNMKNEYLLQVIEEVQHTGKENLD